MPNMCQGWTSLGEVDLSSELPNVKGKQKIRERSKVVQNLTFSHPLVLCMHFYFRITSGFDFIVIPNTVSYPQTTVVNITI
jgi:hypothetical protein